MLESILRIIALISVIAGFVLMIINKKRGS